MSRSILGLATREQRPNLHYDIVEPTTGRIFPPNPSTGWRYSPSKMIDLISAGRILFPRSDTGRPREKKFRSEMTSDFISFRSVIDDVHTADGTQEIRRIFGADIFPFPKPVGLIASLVRQTTHKNDVVLDFFSGSATTAHAVMQVNAEDGGDRRFILVQLPEALGEASAASRAGFRSIAEIGRERIRRVGAGLLLKSTHSLWGKDIGFRVLKVESSNFADVLFAPDGIAQGSLDGFTDNIKPDRTPEDLLFQVMLDWGVDLALPISRQTIQGREVFFVDRDDSNALAACFDASGRIDDAFVKELATHQPLRAVFRDAGFADSAAKINVEQIFKLLSPNTEVKCL